MPENKIVESVNLGFFVFFFFCYPMNKQSIENRDEETS